MENVLLNGITEINLKVNILMENHQELDLCTLEMAIYSKDNFRMVFLMEKVFNIIIVEIDIKEIINME